MTDATKRFRSVWETPEFLMAIYPHGHRFLQVPVAHPHRIELKCERCGTTLSFRGDKYSTGEVGWSLERLHSNFALGFPCDGWNDFRNAISNAIEMGLSELSGANS